MFSFQCFNLDICSLDKKSRWLEYRNKTEKHELLLHEKQQSQEPIICYYRLPKHDSEHTVVLMEMNTKFMVVFGWFIAPLIGIILSLIGILFVYLWYYCPRERQQKVEDYQQIISSEQDHQDI